VLHQPELARKYADRVIGFLAGTVVFDRAPAAVADDEIAALYADEDDAA
jgi:phosphonate transport system ATP-binding protein